MVGSCSPQNDCGGTLHFPSPTHLHHVDPAVAFRQLRRSLSRSPSKVPTFRLVTSKSSSPTPHSPLSPPRAPTPVRSLSENVLFPSQTSISTPSSARRTRPQRKLSPLRQAARPSSAPKSPRKRTLQESSSQGNATPRSSRESSDDQENRAVRRLSPLGDSMLDTTLKLTNAAVQNSPFPPSLATARVQMEHNTWSAKSSPLKRSDGNMARDRSHSGSPSAKRRSLHGGMFSPDFDIFEHAKSQEGQTDTNMTYSLCDSERQSSIEPSSPFPSRSSSLRKTTLQQRQEKPTYARSRPTGDVASEMSSPAHPLAKARSRMSFESVLPHMPRDSPFSSQGSLPNASAHPMFQSSAKPTTSQPQRHPLSRTISQSTSASSMAEDSPTHIPVRQPDQRRHFVDFSKSLPIGATRSQDDAQTDSQTSNFSFATPENYKLVKPLPAAFMSTGLISKKHKYQEPSRPGFGASTSTMPDTPCKRHSLAEMPSPSALKQEFAVKPPAVRHSFGSPSTPFHPNVFATPTEFGRGVGIFGSSLIKGQTHCSDSFLSVEGDDHTQSQVGNGDSQSSNEFEIPPTPTRRFGDPTPPQVPLTAPSTASHRHPARGSSLSKSPAINTQIPPTCKYSSHLELEESQREDSGDKMDDLPAASLKPRLFSPIQRSFTHSRILRNARSPTPLSRASFSSPAIITRRSLAKRSPLSPASPQDSRSFHLSPRTPKENVIPPDPSGLSISQHGEDHLLSLSRIASSGSVFPPATPTAPRDYFARSRASATPSQSATRSDVDPSLTLRFDRAELIGSGEFSQVYRVSRKPEASVSGYFNMPLAHLSPKTPLPDRVWAVKKTRNAYLGPRDRQRKWREVEMLRALGESDHTLQLVDSWDYDARLYIQTEYCEEGSLSTFLEKAGSKARLDDFRIWKILLELSLGLKHIHDANFIHLDLKPANILITFEGTLKIADFGMATSWPAQPGTEGEGDREYMAPEILRGQYDKPADVYSLGLIMLEIAGNVVLPDNGVSWQRLRSGDMSDVPSLTSSSDNSRVARDSSGEPLSREGSFENFYDSDSEDDSFRSCKPSRKPGKSQAMQPVRSGELSQPPAFMVDQSSPEALDNVVRWMITPELNQRPSVDQILSLHAVAWTEGRRRAGATIFEGNWGPADDVLADDAEMIDV